MVWSLCVDVFVELHEELDVVFVLVRRLQVLTVNSVRNKIHPSGKASMPELWIMK